MNAIKNSILVVDDELSIRESFKLILDGPYTVHLAATGESALKKLADEKIELIFLDVRMPGINGLETLQRIKAIDPQVEVIMVTAVNEVQKAGEAINCGAVDYVIKPFDVNQILKMVETTLKKKAIARTAKNIRQEAEYTLETPSLLGSSEIIGKIKNDIEKIAAGDQPILLQGPAGTEKETIARLILKKSPPDRQSLTLETIPKNISLQKSRELFFGKSTGASTVSLEKQAGLLEKATGGILYINHVENLPLDFQGELAQTLAKGSFLRQDYSHPIKFNCRIIATTEADLKSWCEEGRFDSTLLAAIGTVMIELPPLSLRSTDIPLFINAFIEEFKAKYNKKITGLSSAAVDALSAYPFPGNVLELRALIELLVLNAAKELIDVHDLPIEILLEGGAALGIKDGPDLSYDEMQKSFETRLLKTIWQKTNHDLKRSSYLLGISPRVLSTKMESLGIS
ncbi:MAG: sigma-54 dependent transcriptional regulator [Candidatus Margulisiibacteriota bacterium]